MRNMATVPFPRAGAKINRLLAGWLMLGPRLSAPPPFHKTRRSS